MTAVCGAPTGEVGPRPSGPIDCLGCARPLGMVVVGHAQRATVEFECPCGAITAWRSA